MSPFRAARPDAEAQWLLDLIKTRNSPRMDSFANAADARALFAANCKPLDLPQTEMADVVDHRIADATGAHKMLVRDYRPKSLPPSQASGGKAAALVYLHGGGWVVGSPDTHDNICRLMAERAGARVFSVDYRMGPEHRFPAAVDDALAAAYWVRREAAARRIDAARLAVGGDSAGGNLAAVVAIAARDAGDLPIAYQLLIYPATDMRRIAPSHSSNGQGYLLTSDTMQYFHDHYIDEVKHDVDWRASPLLAPSLANLPPALVLTAGFDPLCDEGMDYAVRLTESGNRAVHVCFERQIHGFITMGRVFDDANTAVALCAAELRRALAD